ncbi:MAG TPA: hypothetical protein VFG05_02480 [Methylocella sp.]|nr:hypothetical protein [Methylocella sp.]
MAGIENSVLEHLRPLRGQLDRVGQDIGARKGRRGRLEAGRAQIRVTPAGQSLRPGRLDARVTRIEKRLDLVDG